ncbi:hypothetical protein IRY61_01405, partial [Candidatus Saccharibacteria bacterium]|nr:hypothetical protein [Candidatus Saccharibacteria bacterium]
MAASPELGQVQSTVVDPAGLNLSTGFTYEPYQTGSLMRQTSKTLPGGTVTNYVYYDATETRDNPCTPETEAHKQAGFMKQKVEADPDGTGPQTPRTSEVVYDDAGRTVASRFNNDPWTCVTYDDRGRTTKTVVSTINGRLGRTVTTNYNYQGNPLKTQVVDNVAGTTVTEIDLLGRTVASTDVFGYTTTITYDSHGRVIQKQSIKGTETVAYDNFDRVVEYKLDGVTYATIAYDQYSRITNVDYPAATDGTGNLKLSEIKRDATQEIKGAIYTFSDGTTYDETVSRTLQTGMVIGTTTTFDNKTASTTYQYDSVGRLVGATVDNWQYTYSFGPQDASCQSVAGYNPNAHKNGNRTSLTVANTQNGTSATTKYCYDNADRLVSSTDAQIGTPSYDAHGNITQLDGDGEPIIFTYDASDQNIAIQQGGNKVEYVKDASGTVLVKREYRDGELDKVYRNTSGVLLSCDVANQTECGIVDRYVALPGAAALTLTNTGPEEVEVKYSIQNFHGDTALTVGKDGLPTSSVFMYEPFGQAVASATFGTSGVPNNATDNGMGWATNPYRKQESLFSLAIMQMGARAYIPALGRFIQVDPTEGGTPNSYTYVLDPINYADYNGQWGIPSWVKTAAKVVATAAVVVGVAVVVTAVVVGCNAACLAASAASAAVRAGAAVAVVATRAAPTVSKVASAARSSAKTVMNKVVQAFKPNTTSTPSPTPNLS